MGNKLEERAYLIVRRDNEAQSATVLVGKKVCVPVDARGHCRAFLEKLASDVGKERNIFFQSVVNSGSQSEALDHVASGPGPKAHGTSRVGGNITLLIEIVRIQMNVRPDWM